MNLDHLDGEVMGAVTFYLAKVVEALIEGGMPNPRVILAIRRDEKGMALCASSASPPETRAILASVLTLMEANPKMDQEFETASAVLESKHEPRH